VTANTGWSWNGSAFCLAVKRCVCVCVCVITTPHWRRNGKRRRGRLKKTWWETIQSDMKKVGLERQDAVDRTVWKRGLRSEGGGKSVHLWVGSSGDG